MKTIVFLETQKSASSREAIKAAERMGYYTVLLTNRSSFMEKRTEFPDVHLMRYCDLKNIEDIRNNIKALILKALDISAIISFVDPFGYTACLVAEEFGVNRFSTEAIRKMQDKVISRQLISHLPYTANYQVLTDKSSLAPFRGKLTKHSPVILKSPSSTGSKDVYIVNSYKKLKRYTKKLFKKYPRDPVLVEDYLDGPQYLVEVIVYQKQIYMMAIFAQEITFQNRFIVTGYSLVLNPDAEFYNSLKEAVESIVIAHGMESGACHLELRRVNEQWKLIEINPRISGAGMNKLIEFGLGINMVEQTLKIALGREPNLKIKQQQHVFAQYVTINETGYLVKVTGKNRAKRSPGVLEVYVKPRKGRLLTPPYSMGDRYAYVTATGDDQLSARENAQKASEEIKFWLSEDEIEVPAKNKNI